MALYSLLGLCQSEDYKKTKRIDTEIQKEAIITSKIIKLLLLGSAECGKSTLLKQMKILHQNGFSDEEKLSQRGIIYDNVIESIVAILLGMKKLNIKFDDNSLEVKFFSENCFLEEAYLVINESTKRRNGDDLSTICEAIVHLWNDPGVSKRALECGDQFELPDCASYFLNNIRRIRKHDYKPTDEDILLSRKKTTGIVEVHFRIEKDEYRVFDVGGQRSERKKWIHCFEGVNAIIFLVSVSEFDQVLMEDGLTNRVLEALHLFSVIVNCQWFINTSIILFLNKKDIFLEKIQKNKSIKLCFPSYNGPNSYDAQISYIKRKFKTLNENPRKTIYTYQTCATNTNQVQMIMDSVYDIIIKKSLNSLGFTL